ncbi:serum response factor-binding protein 1-like, partial [Diachasma alloeum]|uniref:serum response factor-binding protein 1-like n=1 Tax=Diachasma alloeum TaxID=454923 RepID=UPI00073841B0
ILCFQIIRMRATVRKARVGVIWKITKQAKLFKNRKHGDEKTLQKCKKKSEKLIREIKAIKSLKDDDIAKFAILNTRSLDEVLRNSKIDRKTRVMTKLAYHKVLKVAVDKFKEKFPHYQLGKRQLANNKLTESLGIKALPCKLKIKYLGEKDQGIKSDNANDNCNKNGNCEDDERSAEETSLVSSDYSENCDKELILSTESEEETPAFEKHGIKRKKSLPSIENRKLALKKAENRKFGKGKMNSSSYCNSVTSNIVEETPEQIPSTPLKQFPKPSKNYEESLSKDSSNSSLTPELKKSPEKSRKSRPVSKLASVKRLKVGESLEEIDGISENYNLPLLEHKDELDTVEDSFFISATPEGVYKSIIVPRPNSGTAGDENSHNRFKESSSRTQRSAHSSDRSLEISGFQKYHKVRQNDFERRRTDFSGIQGSLKDSSGIEFRRDKKFDNTKGKNMTGKEDYSENLHPSWIARKKQQEIWKQGFQGKKTVFCVD